MSRCSFGISPIASLVLASAFWGVATVISKKLLASVPPITLLVVQLAPSVLLLWLLVFARGARPVQRYGLLAVALMGCLNPGLSYTLSMLGLARTTASVATLLWAAEPALIVVMAWLVLREPLTIRLLVVTATAAGGVLLVSGFPEGAGVAGDRCGDVLILGGVLCCALYTVLSRKVAPSADLLFTVALQQSAGLLWAVALWSVTLHRTDGEPVLVPSRSEWLGGAVSGLMYYAAAFWFYLTGLRSVPAAIAGGFLNLIPVFGITSAYVLLGERLTLTQSAGAAVILCSVSALLMWSAPARASEPTG
ncbi:DMT family transporter [Benzoatithermus flavus]|uniref:DMT family transporter n=1 Tax=Benzoatithermus flavus TaxID=3108223 RepID=A0ABU8XLY6_9PROT